MRRLRNRSLILVVVVLGAVAIMLLDSFGFLRPLDDVIQLGLRPASVSLSDIRSSVSGLVTTVEELRSLREQNQELETLVERLTVENLQLSEVASENETLRQFFEFAQTNPTYDFRGGQIIARVIAESGSGLTGIIVIDLGSQHGMKVGMPVVTDRGIVGRISTVYPTTSQILLLNDPNSAINVMAQTTRAPGTLLGRAGRLPVMEYIPPEVEISVGEIIITSGLGGNFPKGLVAGQITDVLRNDNQAFQTATIQPTVDFDRLELVLVITSFVPAPEEEGQVTPTPAAVEER